MNCQSTREAIDSGIVRKMSSTVGKSEATRNSLMSPDYISADAALGRSLTGS